ncbi:RING-type E3 ubiquitin transferase [Quillaja saponaria]|uniref:RING-type E3 ubiquitin transferase n=1 Tax=Quillaja saponaria TaxID=32244 RepID=A0AAD7KQ61_QUISA|nr:RING-type E3 ubiquitin transferase [Quillaja saponaria]
MISDAQSLEIMTDPVTILSGHTYDRSSIMKWFKGGNFNCPNTGQKLSNTECVSNLVLRTLIQWYCSESGISSADRGCRNRDVTRTVHLGSLAAKEAMKMLASFLAYRLETGSREERNEVAYEVRLLSKTNIYYRSCLVEAGCIQHLLKLLSSKDSSTQENSIASLLNLSKHCKSRTHAAATLFYLASIEEYRRLIGETTEAIPALIKLIKGGTNGAKKNALVAMFGLLMHPENQSKVLAAGAVPLLVNVSRSCEGEDLITDSLAILATQAGKYDGTIAVLQSGALHLAVEILSASTSRMGKDYCVSLSRNGGVDVLSLLVKSPSLIGSLYSLLSQGTSIASKKASALIRVLQEFCERSSSSLKTPGIPRQYIHVR